MDAHRSGHALGRGRYRQIGRSHDVSRCENAGDRGLVGAVDHEIRAAFPFASKLIRDVGSQRRAEMEEKGVQRMGRLGCELDGRQATIYCTQSNDGFLVDGDVVFRQHRA